MKLRIVMIIVLLSSFAGMRAQNDPVLAGMIALYTEKAEKELKNQEQVMLLMSTGHIWTKEEVEATINLQREFNSYLDSFRSIICYAAQIYGFYHEITTEEMVARLGSGQIMDCSEMDKRARYLFEMNKYRGEKDNMTVAMVRTWGE